MGLCWLSMAPAALLQTLSLIINGASIALSGVQLASACCCERYATSESRSLQTAVDVGTSQSSDSAATAHTPHTSLSQ